MRRIDHSTFGVAPMLRRPALLIPVIAGSIVFSGCGGEVVKAGGLLARPAARVAARQAVVDLRPALAKFSARSGLVEEAAVLATVTVHSATDAAKAVEAKPSIRAVAVESSANVRTIAETSTADASGRAQIKRCASAGALTAGRSYGGNFVLSKPPPRADVTITKSVGSCLQKAFPEEKDAVRFVTTAITRSMLASSEQVGQTRATAQDYSDRLIYCASLYEEDASADETTPAPAPPTALDRSVDDLLVVVFHAHIGRVAVRQRNWQAAIDNRTAVLAELHRLEVIPELQEARRVLIRAMQASLSADHDHAACDRCLSAGDGEATSYKKAFVTRFNPYIQARFRAQIEASEF
jgi:hypothetical protein